MKIESVVFDLDGTLLDTLGDLRDSVNFALRKNSLPTRSTEEIREFVGNGIRLLIERAVPENTSPEIVDKCFDDFKEYYKTHSAILTKAYDGIIDLMKVLKSKGIKIAVVSNKADFAVKILMEDYFGGLYDCAYGERAGVEKKPAPDGVFGAMNEIGARKESTIYIGDSEVDIETAKNAGLPCVSVTWGFRDKKVLESLCPEYIVDSPNGILNIIERGNRMKVLLVNGGPHEKGCTHTALCEIQKELNAQGIDTEIFWLGNKPVRGCIGCGGCAKNGGHCVFNDDITNTLIDKAAEADGIVLGSPVHYAAPSGTICAVLDRAFYAGGKNFRYKPAAAVVSCRRAGSTAAFEVLNKYFTINNMPIVSSGYWNMVHGSKAEDVLQDLEGLQIMRTLGKNMAWLLKCIETGKANGIERPSEEQKIRTNFIR